MNGFVESKQMRVFVATTQQSDRTGIERMVALVRQTEGISAVKSTVQYQMQI